MAHVDCKLLMALADEWGIAACDPKIEPDVQTAYRLCAHQLRSIMCLAEGQREPFEDMLREFGVQEEEPEHPLWWRDLWDAMKRRGGAWG